MSSLDGFMSQYKNRTPFHVLRTYHGRVSILVSFLCYLVHSSGALFVDKKKVGGGHIAQNLDIPFKFQNKGVP